ncbi:MM3350-like domain-containing protein [Mycena filopes]|nr:MM3350-like domain-containing protein [Mycena filopes]
MDMEAMLRALQGTTGGPGTIRRKPTFIQLAPSDDGSSLPDAFFEHPDTYTKHVGPDGRIRSWGLYPYIPMGQQGGGHEDTGFPMARKMMHQMTYGPLNASTKLLRPEDQFMNAIMARRKRELKQVALVHMPEIATATGEDRIWRRFVVSGGMSLGVFQDKVLAPLMGWVRNFHAHILTDYRDGTQYGPKKSGAIDMMHIDASGYDFLNEDDYCLAHVMSKIGDACKYEYDLGDHFCHDIVLEKIAPLEESYNRVQILGGSGICPMENGNGNVRWAERIETLTKKSGTAAERRELLSEIYSMPNYGDRGWNRLPKFDPDYFDLAETTQAALLGGALRAPSTRKTTREVTSSENADSFGFFEELKKDGRDSRRATACAACGNPNDLKACSGCSQRFYCSQACQKAHWKSTHKRECADMKKEAAA